MTVGELIEMLRQMPQDVQVCCEGCDCINPAKGVHVMEHNGEVLIEVELWTTR